MSRRRRLKVHPNLKGWWRALYGRARRALSRRNLRRLLAALARPDVAGFLLLVLAALTGWGLLSHHQEGLTGAWLRLLGLAFGWGVYFVPPILATLGIWFLLDILKRRPRFGPRRAVGGALAPLAMLAIMHLVPFPEDPKKFAAEGQGGGHVGFLLSELLLKGLGSGGAYILLLAALALGLALLFQVSASGLVRTCGAVWRELGQLRRELFPPRPPQPILPPSQKVESRPPSPIPKAQGRAKLEPPPAAQEPAPRPSRWELPALPEILAESPQVQPGEDDIELKARVIEDTLESFGVPARVVKVNQGPTVTQFGLEPGYVERKDSQGRTRRVRVRVSRIVNLASDLALALSAAPIRIEAPVPGRPYVGIEVPNSEISLVSLRSTLDTPEFREVTSPLSLALGRDVSGRPVVADLQRMPHLLIAGATGSGKSICIKAILTSLLLNNGPDELKLVLIDPKRVELVAYSGIPHLQVPVVVDLERVVGVLQWMNRQMDERYRLFEQSRARDIASYNTSVAPGKRLPYMVLVIDELADMMMMAPAEVERGICRLAQMARATGMHLVVATQRPSVDVVTGLIKANFPARISFAVTSQVDSRVILDGAGAEQLLGRGDGLYMASDSSKLVRLQGCYVSEQEIERLVRFWKKRAVMEEVREGQSRSWAEISTLEETAAEDELLEEAIRLVREAGRASTSLLQRKLRIGYSRAARLLDMMEERGIVGPEEEGGRPREVFTEEGEAGEEPPTDEE